MMLPIFKNIRWLGGLLAALPLWFMKLIEPEGAGNAEMLNKLGIKVVSDLPGVGEEYQDHYTTLSGQSSSSRSLIVEVAR